MADWKILLEPHRKNIDAIDRQMIASCLRVGEVLKVGEIKQRNGGCTRDLEREKAQMRNIVLVCKEAGYPERAITVILAFRSLIESSVRLQMKEQPDIKGEFYCLFCKWKTAGLPEPSLHWPVRPACNMPVLPKEMLTLPDKNAGTGWGR